jgi:hypothetical protein
MGQAQSVSCNFKLVVRGITCCGNDGLEFGLLCSQRIKIGVFFSVGCINLFEACLRRFHFAHATFNGFANGFVGVHLRFLGADNQF